MVARSQASEREKNGSVKIQELKFRKSQSEVTGLSFSLTKYKNNFDKSIFIYN